MDKLTRAYLTTALWSSTDNSRDNGGDPLDRNYDPDDCAPCLVMISERDIVEFMATAESVIVDCDWAGNDLERVVHDLWLTRNEHGAGFWDGDYDVEVLIRNPDGTNGQANLGNKLTQIAQAMGEVDLYVGDDGLIYGDNIGRVFRVFESTGDLMPDSVHTWAELWRANREDEDTTSKLNSLEIGQRATIGGGAAPMITFERVF